MRSKPMILVALLLAAFLVNLDTTLVNVALPALVRELVGGVQSIVHFAAESHVDRKTHRDLPGANSRHIVK